MNLFTLILTNIPTCLFIGYCGYKWYWDKLDHHYQVFNQNYGNNYKLIKRPISLSVFQPFVLEGNYKDSDFKIFTKMHLNSLVVSIIPMIGYFIFEFCLDNLNTDKYYLNEYLFYSGIITQLISMPLYLKHQEMNNFICLRYYDDFNEVSWINRIFGIYYIFYLVCPNYIQLYSIVSLPFIVIVNLYHNIDDLQNKVDSLHQKVLSIEDSNQSLESENESENESESDEDSDFQVINE